MSSQAKFDEQSLRNFQQGPACEIGSDVNRLKAYTEAFTVPMEDFKKKNSTRIAHLLVITKLDTSLIFIAEKTDYNADKTIIVGLVYSDNSDVYSFLRTTCGNCTDSSFAASHLHDIRLGNAGFDDRVTVVKDTSINVVRSEISAKLISALLW